MGAPADEALLDAARAGDADALETLLDRYQGRILRFSRKMCGDVEDARDVLQETLLAMARGIQTFRGESKLSTWLYTIARSHCTKKRRPRRFSAPEISLDVLQESAVSLRDPARGPEQILAEREMQERLDQALANLDPAHREVLVLRDVEGLTTPEAAEVLGMGLAAVKSRLHRARAALRAQVLPLLGRPGEPAAGCPDIAALFSKHLEGDIDAAVCAEMERHLGDCPRCVAVCQSLKQTLQVCRTTPAADVPREVQESIRRAVRAALASAR